MSNYHSSIIKCCWWGL